MLLDELMVDFAMKRGHEMIVDMKTGIKREELDSIEIQMLQGQRIPKLLPVEWIDIDGGLTFRYPLNGKKMLMHRLGAQQITMFQFYTLLLAVVEALDDCRHYMLRPEGFLLHEQYIFIGEHWDDAAIAYVPLREKRMVSSAGEAVLAMAIRWLGGIEDPDGTGLQQIFQHLRGEYVAWDRLRHTLLALLGASYRAELSAGELSVKRTSEDKSPLEVVMNGASGKRMDAISRSTPAKRLERSETVQREERSLPILTDERAATHSGRARPQDVQPVFGNPDKEQVHLEPFDQSYHGEESMEESVLPLTELPEGQAASSSSRMGWILGAGWILVVAVLWRFLFGAAPSRQHLLLCCGLTLLTGTAAFIAWRRIQSSASSANSKAWRGGEWSSEEAFVPNSIQLPSSSSLRQSFSKPEGNIPGELHGELRQAEDLHVPYAKLPQTPHRLPPRSPHAAPSQTSLVTTSHAETPATMSLGTNAVTVLLGQAAKETIGVTERLPWLDRKVEGLEERIKLEQSHFVIGRSNDGAHYVDQSSGISRAHIELLGKDGHWSVKDMGSRNGSTLNGNAMVPYKTYGLSDTDALQLAGDQGPVYVFRAG